jgi:CBS domain-containing protein
MCVADVMTLDPVFVGVADDLETAERLMSERNVSGLPVVDGAGSLVGVVSRTDLLGDGTILATSLLRRRPSGLRVGELMTSPAVTVPITESVVEAARVMRDQRIHRVVAIDDRGRPAGILSSTDYVALVADL